MKTTFGLSKTLCDIVEKVSERIETNDKITPYFNNYETTKYKLFAYKSVTNIYFLLQTDKKVENHS